MAKNDKLLVDGIIDERIAARSPSDDRGEAFEFFALEQVMKEHDLSELKLILVTCKHHDTFLQATLDAVLATLNELLQFSIEDTDLEGSYSDALLVMRRNLKFAYRKLSPKLMAFSASVYYVSRGDTTSIGEEVVSRGNQIASSVQDCFAACTADFAFLGATVSQYWLPQRLSRGSQSRLRTFR
jgi:hypothetical protein